MSAERWGDSTSVRAMANDMQLGQRAGLRCPGRCAQPVGGPRLAIRRYLELHGAVAARGQDVTDVVADVGALRLALIVVQGFPRFLPVFLAGDDHEKRAAPVVLEYLGANAAFAALMRGKQNVGTRDRRAK